MPLDLDRRAALAGLTATLIPLGPSHAAGEPRILVAKPVSAKLSSKAESPADLWLLDGDAGGPILRAKAGEPVGVTLRNETPKPLSLHWHGVRGLAATDGVAGFSAPAIAPGASGEIRFVPPDPGTFLIRPLVPGEAGELAGRGIGGMLVVEEKTPPAIDHDVALLVRDWLLASSGALAPFGDVQAAAGPGRLGNLVAAGSGEIPRRIEVAPGARIRLRIANGCNARIMRIRFDGARAFVGAVDGQPTETFEPLRSSLPFAPGARYDVFLDAPGKPGEMASVVAMVGPGLTLAEIVAGTGAPIDRGPPASLPLNPALPPQIQLQNAARATLTLTGGAPRPDGPTPSAFSGDPKAIWAINGRAGSAAGPPLFTARRGQPVVLGIVNQTGFNQPVHLHGHVFRLLHALDDGWEPYWLDTVQIADGKTIHISFLAGNPGRWAISSAVLERFDTGLWTWFEVT